MSWVRRYSSGRAHYLFLLFLVPAVATFGHYITPEKPVLFGQDLGIVAGLLLAVAGILTWFFFRGKEPRSWRVSTFFILLLITWVYQVLRMRSGEMGFNYTAFIVPVAVVMMWIKPIGRTSLEAALLVLGYSLAVIAVISFVFGEAGFLPSGFNVSDGEGLTRFMWLDVLGIETRWGGAWTSVNRASAAGGLLLVIGAVQRRWHRVVLMSVGAAVLMLGGSRAALMAAGLSLLIIVLTQGPIHQLRHRTIIRIGAIVGLVVLFISYITLFDPTLALRTPIWSYFLDLVPRSGLFGVGDAGVSEYVAFLSANDPDFLAHTDPHNIFLDWLVRYGWVMIALSLAILGMAAVMAVKALLKGVAAPAALLAYVVIYGSADTILSWIYWTPFLIVVIWSFLYATSVLDESDMDSTTAATVNRQ